LVLACVVVGAGLAFGVSSAQEKEYTAKATLLFRDPGLARTFFGSFGVDVQQDPDRDAATNADLVSLPAIAEKAAASLGGGLTGRMVESHVSVEPRGGSNLVTIAAVASDPQMSAQIANAVGKEYISFRRAADRAKVAQAEELVQQQITQSEGDDTAGSSQVKTLRQRLEQLRVLEALQTGNAELVQPAVVPEAPSSPRPGRDALIGAFLGLIVGCLGALFAATRDRRLRSVEELESIWRVPLLAAIPTSKELESLSRARTFGPYADSFAMVRTRLRYFNLSQDASLILITSALPGEGKSMISWNLGLAAALSGTPTLLIEADLRRPTVASRTNHPGGLGLSDVLAGLAEVDAVTWNATADSSRDSQLNAIQFDVLSAGTPPPNPAQLLETERMTDVLRWARNQYGFIVVDTPPSLGVPDALPLMSSVDGVIVVGRLGHTTRDASTRLEQQFANTGAPVIGIIANGVPDQVAGGYYGYGPYTTSEAQPGAAAP
jgi:capsular exopolysaccharide synthesis family protein